MLSQNSGLELTWQSIGGRHWKGCGLLYVQISKQQSTLMRLLPGTSVWKAMLLQKLEIVQQSSCWQTIVIAGICSSHFCWSPFDMYAATSQSTHWRMIGIARNCSSQFCWSPFGIFAATSQLTHWRTIGIAWNCLSQFCWSPFGIFAATSQSTHQQMIGIAMNCLSEFCWSPFGIYLILWQTNGIAGNCLLRVGLSHLRTYLQWMQQPTEVQKQTCCWRIRRCLFCLSRLTVASPLWLSMLSLLNCFGLLKLQAQMPTMWRHGVKLLLLKLWAQMPTMWRHGLKLSLLKILGLLPQEIEPN